MKLSKTSARLLVLGCNVVLLSIVPTAGYGTEGDIDVPPISITEDLPHYQGEGSFYLGLKLVDVDLLSRVAEYEDEDSSIIFGVDAIACPLPHRYHLHVDYHSENSYYGDIGYAYRDILLFRDLSIGIHHNLDHYHYLYPGDPPRATYEDRSAADENYIDFYKNDMLFRVKAPDYPFHVFFKTRYVKREGEIEERFLAGGIGNMIKTSESRKIDWDSKGLTLGLNSHLGPVEVEYTYGQAEFDPDAGVLYDYYPDSVFGRPGDTYPHNVVPETESVANTLKFHSSYTGQIVISSSFSSMKNTNNYSGAEAEAWKAALDLRWIPDPKASFVFRFRHHEMDKDNPEEVTVSGRVHINTFPVRQPVSYQKDQFFFSARYRPLSKLTLLGNYQLEFREKSNIDDWVVLQKSTDIHKLNLAAQARPLKKLKLKALYEYTDYENPSYNTEPDTSSRVRLNATYSPATWITALLDFSKTETKRDQLRYISSAPSGLYEEGERDGAKDYFLGSLAFVVTPDITITTSWNYTRWETEQDLTYAHWNTSGNPYYDRGVSYTDKSNTWSAALYYLIRKDLTLTADFSYTLAKGEFWPSVPVASGEANLGTFSEIDTDETTVSVELTKKVLEFWEVGLMFRAALYNDELSDAGADHQDGELFISSLTLKRSF